MVQENCAIQGHIHEIFGSTKLAQRLPISRGILHAHRFSGMTGEAIQDPCQRRKHFHEFALTTDFFNHFHVVCGRTTLDIPVGEKRHVHFAIGNSSENDKHFHLFLFATAIENYLGD